MIELALVGIYVVIFALIIYVAVAAVIRMFP